MSYISPPSFLLLVFLPFFFLTFLLSFLYIFNLSDKKTETSLELNCTLLHHEYFNFLNI